MTDKRDTSSNGVEREPAPRLNKDGTPRKRKGRSYTAATISRDIRAMGLTSLHFVGGVKYLNRVAKTNPAAYLAFIAKLIKQEDGTGSTEGITFVVRTMNVVAGPIPGVLASPVQEHVAPLQPLKLIANGAADE